MPSNVITPHGTWGYKAGASGTVYLSGGKRLISFAAHAQGSNGTIMINDGDAIIIPNNSWFTFTAITCLLLNPKLTFSFTNSYFLEFVS